MARASQNTQSAQRRETATFGIQFKMTSDEFAYISMRPPINKSFFTSYDNVACRWNASFSSRTSDNNNIRFRLICCGPLGEGIVNTTVSLISKNDNRPIQVLLNENCKRDAPWDRTISRVFNRTDFNATNDNGVHLKIVLKIPLSAFAFSYIEYFGGPTTPVPDWLIKVHSSIETPESKNSDVQMVSNDGKSFYCHQIVLNAQSTVFEAMFRNATTEEQLRGIFRFPSLNSDELSQVIKYVYIGTTNLETTAITNLMLLADFAEQYGLKGLKYAAAQRLWVIAGEKPLESIDIARFADLHYHTGLDFLRHRCFDILADNYKRLGLKIGELFQISEEPPQKKRKVEEEDDESEDDEDMVRGDLGDVKLREDFVEFLRLRFEPTIG